MIMKLTEEANHGEDFEIDSLLNFQRHDTKYVIFCIHSKIFL
jgi:hypothetical protein